jgi:cobyrinic acid a,c-diamide synthase
MPTPRGLIVAAAASHSGKTIFSIGLITALKALGLRVAAAKCGPDYIDPKFLEAASGAPAINLDPWAMSAERVRTRIVRHTESADILVVEGVMGLFDGGAGGAGSTASLAKITGLPVLLVIGAQGLAQTAAAVAEGCARLADGFSIAGAIVNQVASDRHADLIREGFARISLPLLGLVRRDSSIALPSRHLGLVQAEEHADLARKIARAGELVTGGGDLDQIIALAGECGAAPPPCGEGMGEGPLQLAPLGQRIAVARDVAFAFSYPHLLQDWRDQGAEISFFSPLHDEGPPPDTDAVYLPGGYPELYAKKISAAESFRAGMQASASRGALIYGECGGYMVLGDTLTDAEGKSHRMLGLLPVSTSFEKRKLHLGYRKLTPLGGLPWHGTLTAHEFHFASIVSEGEGDRLFEVEDAAGEKLAAIGFRRNKVMGSFAHVIDAT